MKAKKLTHLFGLVVLMLLVSGQAFAQNIRVTGRVLDELGEGLIGAGVVIQGTTSGTVTDLDVIMNFRQFLWVQLSSSLVSAMRLRLSR